VAHVRLDCERLDTLLAKRGIAPAEPRQVVHPCDLEPDEVLGVVGDALGIGLGEANPDVRVEMEAVDEGRL
jgi:hypothetical protein